MNDGDKHVGGDLCVFLRDRFVSFLEFVVDVDEEIGIERIALRELQMRRNDQRARMVLAKQQDRGGRDNPQTVHFLKVRIAAFSDLLEDAAARWNVQRQPIKSAVDRELGVRSASHKIQRECGIWKHRIGRRGLQPPSCRSANTTHTRDEGSSEDPRVFRAMRAMQAIQRLSTLQRLQGLQQEARGKRERAARENRDRIGCED